MFSGIKLTYHQRLFVQLVIYSWLFVGCFVAFQYHREKQFKAEELNGRLQMVNTMLLSQINTTGSITLPGSDIPDLRVSVIEREGGRVIYDNSLDALPGTSHLDRAEIADALSKGEGWTLRRHSQSTGQTYFYSAKLGDKYLVRTAVPYSVNLNHRLSADYAFLWFMAGVTVIMCIVGFFATRRVSKHVRRLSEFAKMAERGERIVDTESFPHDELGDISSHIVRLYAKLQRTTNERDREHTQALHEQSEKIRIKRQLTDNINHELKTPVAAMQVCLETLTEHKNLPEARRDEFLGRCLEANRRLKSLLDDVSALTRIEDGADKIATSEVDVAEIVQEICRDYGPELERRGITLSVRMPESIKIKGNATLISSIFHNLMANAIAYSDGTKIEIDGDGKGNFTFSDNGRGVEAQHLDKIFERFYRIDKGRSRRQGGTGLGLSIVRNAVQWHGGQITATIPTSGGLRFTFTLTLPGR